MERYDLSKKQKPQLSKLIVMDNKKGYQDVYMQYMYLDESLSDITYKIKFPASVSLLNELKVKMGWDKRRLSKSLYESFNFSKYEFYVVNRTSSKLSNHLDWILLVLDNNGHLYEIKYSDINKKTLMRIFDNVVKEKKLTAIEAISFFEL